LVKVVDNFIPVGLETLAFPRAHTNLNLSILDIIESTLYVFAMFRVIWSTGELATLAASIEAPCDVSVRINMRNPQELGVVMLRRRQKEKKRTQSLTNSAVTDGLRMRGIGIDIYFSLAIIG